MPVDDQKPSTSREGTFRTPRTSPMRRSNDQCDESGSNKKRKPHSTDDEYNGTAKKLRIARDDSPQLARHSDVADDTDSTGSISSRDPVLPRTVDRVIQSLPVAGKRTYNVSGLKRTFHGIAYQWKHLMLILHRARKEGYPFRLDTELDAAEKFDDVVLEYVDSKRGMVHRFMQIKHKQDDCKMITATDLKAKLKAKDNAFSIVKYFISWREIQKNPDFRVSTSKEFVLCTNIGLDVTELDARNIEVKHVVTDDLLKVTVDLKKKPLFYKLVNKPSSLRDKLKSEASASEVEISKFFEEFILAVNQPNEMELGEMINHEIRAYSQFNLQNMDLVWGSFQNRIVNWLKKSGSHNKFLEKPDADAFFVEMERALSSLITVGLNLMYWSELKEYDIKFERDNEDLEKFIDGSISNHIRILKLISSKQTLLTALMVYQTLEDSGKYQEKDSFIFIHLEKLMLPDIMNDVLRAFESSHSHSLMVIDCGTSSVTQGEPNFWNRLREIVETSSGKKMILIIQGNNDPALQFEVGCQIVYEKNSDISIDNLKECSRQKLLEKSIVKFQGHDERTNFGRLLDIRDCGDIESTKLSALRKIIDQQTLTQLIRGKEIPIGGEVRGLCEVEKYYIPRNITRHVVIKISVFQDPEMPDLFAITGIDLKSLERLLASQEGTYDFDESNATKFDPVKCRFLEKDRAEDHFKNICDQNPNRNIHWLQAESGKLLWQRSHGNITNLMAFEETVVHDENAERPGVRYFTEDQLMHHAEECKIVIIFDTAGMGKSTVLTHFAEKLNQNQPSPLVIKVDLTQHTSALDEQRQKRTFDASDTDNAVDFLVEKLSCLDTELEREVFKEIIKVIGGAALLFDGFDEISPEYESIVIDLLKAVSILSINRLIVTTRPHTNKGLEMKLATFAYHLQPFSPTNQTEFLIAFWKKGLNSSDDIETVEENLNKHASEVLKFLVASIDRRMEDFTGIPLLTRMVAEIFPYEEKGTQINPAESRKAYTIIDLYRLFVEKNIKVFCKEKQLGDDTNSAHRMHSKLIGKMIIIIHQKLALEALFPDETVRADLISCQPEKDKMSSFLKEEIEPVERIGIVTQVINKNPHFVHRTFAEYFTAQFLIDTLIDNRRNEVVRRFFVAEIFVQPQYKTIRAFLNCLLSDKDYATDDEKESWKFSLSEYFSGIAGNETLYHVAVDENNHEIIKFFSHRLSKLDCLRQKANIDLENYFFATPLNRAISLKKSDIVKLLVEKRADIKSIDKDGWTPLHNAILIRDLNIVRYIVEAGACINSLNKYGQTPLHHAVPRDWNIMRYIVEAGADINSVDNDGWTPLHYAVKTKDLNIVKYIVEAGADNNSVDKDGWTPLHYAVLTRDLNIVRYIVEAGTGINSIDKDGLTPLHYAVKTKDLNIVRYTVEAGASINAVDKDGLTPLHYAVKTKDLDIVSYTVEAGADIDAVEKEGLTPLYYAVKTKDLNIVRYIIEAGACLNSVDKDSLTPLHYAVKTEDLNMVRYIVEAGACLNSVNNYGWAPLHYAVVARDLNIVRYLVEAGAGINSVDEDSWTPLHYAVKTEDLNIVRCIVDAGADNNSVDKDGWTPLHYAVLTRDLNIVRYTVGKDADNHGTSDVEDSDMVEINHSLENRPMVISKAFQKSTPLHRTVEVKSLDAEGAVINSKSKRGLTPLHLAVISGRSDIVQYLLKESANVNTEADFGLTPRHIAVHLKDSGIVACLDEYGANFDPADDRRLTLKQLKLRGKFLATIMQYEDMINFRGAATRSLCSLRMLCYILKLDFAESFIYCSFYPEA